MTWLRTLQDASARRELAMHRDRIMLGVRSVEPALQAAIDQHAAAIRDILRLTAGMAGPVELAAYARGVHDSAVDHGWSAKRISVRADWVTIRLLSACRLAFPAREEHYDLADLPSL